MHRAKGHALSIPVVEAATAAKPVVDWRENSRTALLTTHTRHAGIAYVIDWETVVGRPAESFSVGITVCLL